MNRLKIVTIVILALGVLNLSAQKTDRVKLLKGEWRVACSLCLNRTILGNFISFYAKDSVDAGSDRCRGTVFQLKGDSIYIKIGDYLAAYKISTLTQESLILGPYHVANDLPDTFKVRYIRPHYLLDTMPTFDKIIIGNTIVSSDGKVVRIEGQANGAKLETATMTVNDYNNLQNSFRRADIKNIRNVFNAGCADCPSIYVTFEKDGKIYKSIITYEYTQQESAELTEACKVFHSKVGSLTYTPSDTNKVPVYLAKGAIASFNDTANKNVIHELGISESALLRYYLINGKKTNAAFKQLYGVSLEDIRYCCMDILDNYHSKVTKVRSDGRYYKFYFGNEQPVTIDIGFNFIERNSANLVSKKQ